MGLVKTYDPKKVIVTFGGVPITGFADGTFVQVDPNAESFTRKVGADGEVVRAKTNDNTHTVVITLQQSSASNSFLGNAYNTDKLTGAGMLPLSITDLNGGTIAFWPQAWIQTDPSWGYAKETTDRGWTLHTGQIATNAKGGAI